MSVWTKYLGQGWTLRLALICMAGIVVNCLLIGPGLLSATDSGSNDFRHFYLGAKLSGGPGLYDIAKFYQAQLETYGANYQHQVPNRLPFYYFFIGPLARLPYHPAWLLWFGANVTACFAFAGLGLGNRRTELAVVCCWCYPLLLSLAIGQDLGFLLFILGVALRAVEHRWHMLAGLALSLCAIKFHFFFLLPLLFLGRREKRMTMGFAFGIAILLAVSFLVQGPDWPFAYVSIVLNPRVNTGDAIMPNLHGLASTFGWNAMSEGILSLAVIAMAWRLIRRGSFEVGFAATLLGGLLLSRHAYPADCAILIPALLVFVLGPFGLLVRGLACALLLPSTYLLLLASGPAIPVALMILLLAAVGLESSAHKALPETVRQRAE